ncbi:sensor histidine kinase [Phnomibacter ginsenosidimutans]|uniref:sensor histidine kinase n=1 Tax=Phnomibacter ginsenosidimutans TaxID=2676868 RepID=UPI0018D213C7|nr:sensor histidine kinase [Phnomibacter ginsenosidimutans]
MLERKIERIDSLMDKYASNGEQAKKEAAELYKQLTTKYNTAAFRGFKIDVMLQQAILYSLSGSHHQALQLSLEALDEAEKFKYPERIYRSCWVVAIMYENGRDYTMCRKYLDKAYRTYEANQLNEVYSTYCIRMSSYFMRVEQKDSAQYFAFRGLDSALKYQNKRDIRDAYLLLGTLLAKQDYKAAVRYKLLAADQFIQIEDYATAALQLTVASTTLLNQHQTEEALKYSDTALLLLQRMNVPVPPLVYQRRSEVFEQMRRMDSALYYYQLFHEGYVATESKQEAVRIKQISEEYQTEKKEAIIKNRERQILLISLLLAVISIAAVLLYRKNRRIRQQNNIIGEQLNELTKAVEHKKVLLSELQHRVKNNLQHVISILEIQKESVDFNNIEEVLRGNQNRIHSMALLHKKLRVTDTADEVDLQKYICELAALVKESYDISSKRITLEVNCNVEKCSIAKALPIGLIITELVSNSMKHAFKHIGIGIIEIELTKDDATGLTRFYYADNGEGFDFYKKSEKGLGQEIVMGLIDQLDGTVETNSQNGFELTIKFA